MAVYKLSGKASVDVEDIYEYTIVNFGIEQARTYLHGLDDCFKALTENPLEGRAADELALELRRYEYQSHVVFYREMEQYTLIVRVLHKSMDFARHV
jgi:toxin ParE1/3/4